jgi:hypothetical protein
MNFPVQLWGVSLNVICIMKNFFLAVMNITIDEIGLVLFLFNVKML